MQFWLREIRFWHFALVLGQMWELSMFNCWYLYFTGHIILYIDNKTLEYIWNVVLGSAAAGSSGGWNLTSYISDIYPTKAWPWLGLHCTPHLGFWSRSSQSVLSAAETRSSFPPPAPAPVPPPELYDVPPQVQLLLMKSLLKSWNFKIQ